MSDIAARVAAAAEASGETSVAFLRELIALQRAGEDAVQDRVAQAAEAAGCIVERRRYKPADVQLREEFADQSAIATDERVAVLARLPGTGGGAA